MFEGKKILVTGGAGFVGSNLIKHLLQTGADIRATLHKRRPQIKDSRIDYLRCDLRREEDCKRVCRDVEFIFHCAANTSGAAVIEKTPLVHLTPNLIINSLILEAAYFSGITKLLFISSSIVYPYTDYSVKEGDVTNEFFEKYFIAAWMKRFSEIMCEMYSTRLSKPMATVVVRPANIYGPMDNFEWETSHVIPAFIRRVVERQSPIAVWGNGLDKKDFIFVDDFIDGLLLAMEKIERFDIVNIASGREYCLREILDLIIKIDAYKGAMVEYDKSKPTMIPKRLIDTSKAKKVLGFEAKTPIEEGLIKTIEWYKSICSHS